MISKYKPSIPQNNQFTGIKCFIFTPFLIGLMTPLNNIEEILLADLDISNSPVKRLIEISNISEKCHVDYLSNAVVFCNMGFELQK